MLCLGMTEGKRIYIGDDISIMYLGGVRIGIEAPKEVAVLREEAIVKEKKDDKESDVGDSVVD